MDPSVDPSPVDALVAFKAVRADLQISPVPTGMDRLARWLQRLLALNAAMALGQLGWCAWGLARAGSDAQGGGFLSVQAQVSLLALAAMVACGVLWLTWQYTLAGSRRINRSALRRPIGWHLAAWVVPVISWWWPYQNVADLLCGARAPRLPDGGGSVPTDRSVPTVMRWWWACWVLSNLLAYVGLWLSDGAATVSDLRPGLLLAVATALLNLAAALLAIRVVRIITAYANS
jgi:hypothetical protein